MQYFSFLYQYINGAVGNTFFLSFVIMLGAMFLEDTTVIIVGMLASDGVMLVPFALTTLYVGIVVGDIGLYYFGRFASTHPRFAHYVDHDFVTPFRTWLENRFVLTVFSARFIPGARLPTYAASGFFQFPFGTFITTTMTAMALWTTTLFSLSYWFGSLTSRWMGPARWGIALVCILTLFVIGRHNFRTYHATKKVVGTGDGTRMTSA